MSPIRIAFIGLSKTPGWSSRAHLPYLQQSSKYTIVGVLNSSRESSEAAIKAYGLDASTRAYGSAAEMADDSDSFDLAVCAVRVDKHHAAIKPLVLKGKQCYVEWPLTRTFPEADDLLSILGSAPGGPARTVVGLQGRATPVVRRVRALLESGAIGRVVSSSVVSSAGNVGAVDPASLGELFNDSRVGANMLSIHFGHVVDYVLFALERAAGGLASVSASLSTQFAEPGLRSEDGTVTGGRRDTPDHILLQGRLGSGAVLSVHQRGGEPFKGEPGLAWRIFGDRGEVMVTASGSFLQIGYDDVTVRVHDHASGEVREVGWGEDELAHLPLPARNVARVYEAFADGREDAYADWEEALARHRLLEKMIESSEKGTWVSI